MTQPHSWLWHLFPVARWAGGCLWKSTYISALLSMFMVQLLYTHPDKRWVSCRYIYHCRMWCTSGLIYLWFITSHDQWVYCCKLQSLVLIDRCSNRWTTYYLLFIRNSNMKYLVNKFIHSSLESALSWSGLHWMWSQSIYLHVFAEWKEPHTDIGRTLTSHKIPNPKLKIEPCPTDQTVYATLCATLLSEHGARRNSTLVNSFLIHPVKKSHD